MRVSRKELKKWGNSTGIRFTQEELNELGMHDTKQLRMVIEGGSMTLTPIHAKPQTLDELFADDQCDPIDREQRYEWNDQTGRERL